MPCITTLQEVIARFLELALGHSRNDQCSPQPTLEWFNAALRLKSLPTPGLSHHIPNRA